MIILDGKRREQSQMHFHRMSPPRPPHLRGKGVNIPHQCEALVRSFAILVEQQLQECLASSTVMQEIEQQWKKSLQAQLPLAILGHEENPQHLWAVVTQLDQRFRGYPDPDEDETISMRRLESALDACSAQIIEEAQARIAVFSPRAKLVCGLIDGYWCIAAFFLRESWNPSEKPLQLSLF